MAINDELLKDARGKAIRIDASLDKFSTIAYRWGSVAGELDGTNMYSSRVLSLAPILRGLGQNRIAGGGTCELRLANADGGLDALVDADDVSVQAKLRLRIYLVLWTPGASPISLTSKLLGEFSLGRAWISQDNETLTLPLGDDIMGSVAQLAALPTLQDWHDVGGSAATNPLYDAWGMPDSINEYTPVQLAFGEDWVHALPHLIPFGVVDAAYQKKVIVPVCCTSSTAAASQDEITSLRINWYDANAKRATLIDVPRTVWDEVNETDVDVWTVERSPTITKDGKSFKIIYLVVRDDLGALNRNSNYITGYHAPTDPVLAGSYESSDYGNEFAGGYPPMAIYQRRGEYGNSAALPQYGCFAAGVRAWYVKGVPLSARTQTTSNIQHPTDVLTDLVSHYSNNTSITVNTTERDRVKAATTTAACAGVVQPWTLGASSQSPSLRQVITAICQSSDIDVFIDWNGQFSFSADFWDFRISSQGTATWTPDGAYQTSGNGVTTQYIPTVIPETWLRGGLRRKLPGDGERWAPFNRLWFVGGKAYPAEGLEVPFQGPWDFDTAQGASIALADRLIEATLEQGWRPYRQQTQEPWHWRQVNIVARYVVRFRVHLGGLQLELGQYFALSWTRGPSLGSPYSGTIFQCEAITYAQGDDTVEVVAVWRDDVTTERQYILDDETLIVRSKGVLTGACVENAGDITYFDFTGTINLTTMGVEAGDILVLRDTSEAADSFLYNRTYRIVQVISATNIEVDASHTDTGHSVPNAEWAIQRGATTYPTAVSDPTNYPLGGEQYGKVTDTDGEYSNAETGNRLISG